MKRTIEIAVALIIALSLVACGTRASTASKEESGYGAEPEKQSDVSIDNSRIDNSTGGILFNLFPEDGILAVFGGDYGYETYIEPSGNPIKQVVWVNHIVLARINPSTGTTSIFRDFSAKDSNIQIDAAQTLVFSRGDTCSKNYMRQSFDSSYTKIIAKDNDTGSWGWVDSEGDYTNVTGQLFSDDGVCRDIAGIGFHDDYYFFVCSETPQSEYERYMEEYIFWMQENDMQLENYYTRHYFATRDNTNGGEQVKYNSSLTVYRVPINQIDSKKMERVPISAEGEIDYMRIAPLLDIYDNCYLIQSDSDEVYAYHFGSDPFYCSGVPIYCAEIGGDCVPEIYFSDWISPEEAIGGFSYDSWDKRGNIYKITSFPRADWNYKGVWELNEHDSFDQLIVGKHGNVNEHGFSEYEYDNPIVSPDKTKFACIENYLRTDELGTALVYSHISVFTLAGEKLIDIGNTIDDDTSSFSIDFEDGNKVSLIAVIDWL